MFVYFCGVKVKPWAFYMLGKCFVTDPYPQPRNVFYETVGMIFIITNILTV